MAPWTILGIDPTTDKKAIRRAYARRLKALTLDHGAAAFEELRDAREQALRQADGPAPRLQIIRERVICDREAPDEPAPDIVVSQEIAGDETKETAPRVVETGLVDGDASALLDDRGTIGARTAYIEARLQTCLTPLADATGEIDRAGFDAILRRIADLPMGMRRAVERTCIGALADGLISKDGAYDAARALRIRPLLLAAADILGWSLDETILDEALTYREARTIRLMLDGPDDLASLPEGPLAARITRFDARVLFENDARRLAIHKMVAAGRPPRWGFDGWACPIPYIWAFRHRYAAIGFAWYLAGAIPAFVALSVPRYERLWIDLCAVLTVVPCVASGFLADHTAFFYAWRRARGADRRGLFEPLERTYYLRKRGAKAKLAAVTFFAVVLFWASMFPYLGLALLADQLP